MILTALITGAAIIAGVGIVAAFWNDMIDWLKRAIAKVESVVAGILYGSRVFVIKISEGVQEISRHYSKVEDHWQETTVTKTVSASEVPQEILDRANLYQELDITEDLELQLQSA